MSFPVNRSTAKAIEAEPKVFPKRKPLLMFTLLTGLGLAGNYFAFPVFFSIDFLFGSIFSMLALQLLGPRLGVASALVAGALTQVVWAHRVRVWVKTHVNQIFGSMQVRTFSRRYSSSRSPYARRWITRILLLSPSTKPSETLFSGRQ